MTSQVTLTRHARVGVLTLDNPPVNALSHPVRVALLEQLRAAARDPELDAVVIACAGRTFVAGADIREFGKPPLAPDLPELVEYLDSIDKPLIAALHGTALGGGLELALACHYRVAASNARVGLPEVTLGILPGAGGTQRLPRIVGVRVALDLIVRGTIIPATKARALGLLDELVADELTARAVAFAERVVAERRPLPRASAAAVADYEASVFEEYEQLAARQWRGFLAPSRCIAAVRAAAELPFAEGLRRERELFVELMSSAQSKAQRHIFFAERELARIPGAKEEAPARAVKSAGVLGGGPLAEQLVACFAGARLPVVLFSAVAGESEASVARLRSKAVEAVAQGTLAPKEAEERLALIRPVIDEGELAVADLVLDATPGGLLEKRALFERLDAVCKPGALLAATSAWFDVDALAAATQRPGDVIGLHFSEPLDGTRALEIARAAQSSPEACATAMKLGRTLGRVSALVAARPGLVSERLRARVLLESLRLLEAGASAEQIDRVLFEFGMPTGWDGSEVKSGRGVVAALETLTQLDWQTQWAPRDAVALERALTRARERNYGERADSGRVIPDREVLERCVFSMVIEGARLLEEKVVPRPLEVDMMSVHGLGFPVYRGGPLFYADELGLAAVYDAALKYGAEVDPKTWEPPELLRRLSQISGRFYGSAAGDR